MVLVVRPIAGRRSQPGISLKCGSRRDPDVKTSAVHAVLAVFPPADKTVEDIEAVESALRDQRVSQAKRHAGVIGPFARLQPEWTATNHLGDVRECISLRKFERNANRVANRKPEH